jgi:hypothetical protein
MMRQGSGSSRLPEDNVNRKFWLGAVVAVAVASGLFFLSPRLGGLALIVLALGVVTTFAYRLL